MQVLIDFCDPHGGTAATRCAFAAPLQTLVAHTLTEVQPLLDRVQALSQQGHWCVGYLRYEAAPAFDAALVVHPSDGPLAWFGVYQQALPWPEPLVDSEDHPTRVDWHPPLSRADFDANLAALHQAIGNGECYQVNYTNTQGGDFSGQPLALFQRLQQAQPGGYAAYIDSGFEQVLSVSPELFFDWRPHPSAATGDILTRPMKGTAARGGNAAEDAAQVAALLASAKERAENVMIVDLLRNDLSRIALPHSVQVPQRFQVQTLPTVLQMVSDVSAVTRPGTRLSQVFGALFPCGSITGAPKVQAMRRILALEPEARGVYCGAIGLLRPGGHATFNVAIRTVTLRAGQARCGIGSGITYDATADAEWLEWQHKRGFLLRASQSFKLLETLCLERGTYINLIAHSERITLAARHFGFKFEASRVQLALEQLVHNLSAEEAAQVWRVRLQVASNGQPTLEKFVLNQPPAQVTLALATTAFEAAQSEFTRFKTTHRAHYDVFAPGQAEVFDTLLYNTAEELTECTRGNIALLLDGRWVTPPLRCGLLGGIGRALYLQQGRLTEAVVTLQDLPRVQALAFVNSLRGWLPARLLPHLAQTLATTGKIDVRHVKIPASP